MIAKCPPIFLRVTCSGFAEVSSLIIFIEHMLEKHICIDLKVVYLS